MKIYMNNQSNTPEGWESVEDYKEVVRLLSNGKVDEISLSHNGMPVLEYMEELLSKQLINKPHIHIHTSSSFFKKTMEAKIEKIDIKLNSEWLC